jgi:hypothetical protein
VAFSPREYGSRESYKDFSSLERSPKEVEKNIEDLWK